MSRKPPLVLIFTVTITGILNNTLITPAVPDILGEFHQQPGRAGILIAAGSTAGIVLAPLIGFLADRFGRRSVLTTCLVVFGVFGASSALAPSFEVLLVARFLQGFGSAGLVNLAVVLIGDNWTGLDRTKYVGRNSAILTVGLATIPVFSGTITQFAGWRITLGLYTLAFATAGWVWLTIDERRPESPPPIRDQLGGAIRIARAPLIWVTIGVGYLVFLTVFGVLLTALPVHLADDFGLGAAARGVIISIPAVTSSMSAFNLSRIRSAISARTIVAGGAAGLGVAFLLLGLGPAVTVVVIGAFVYGFFEGALIPTLQDLIVEGSPDDHRGSIVALWVGAVRLGQTSGSLLAGLGIGLLGAGQTMALGATVAAVVTVIGVIGPFPRRVPATA